MADLKSLIRVRKYGVEQKQKLLSELYRQAEELQNQKQTMLNQLADEEEKTREMDIDMLSYFAPYAKAVKSRVKEIDNFVIILDKRIAMAQEDMRAAFAELKKVEITQETREDEENAVINKKESDELDDIALQIFRRKQEEG